MNIRWMNRAPSITGFEPCLVFSMGCLYVVTVTWKLPKLNVGSTLRILKFWGSAQNLSISLSVQSYTKTAIGCGEFVTIRTNRVCESVLEPSLSLHINISGNRGSFEWLPGTLEEKSWRRQSADCCLFLGSWEVLDAPIIPPTLCDNLLTTCLGFRFSLSSRTFDSVLGIVRTKPVSLFAFPCGRVRTGCSSSSKQ